MALEQNFIGEKEQDTLILSIYLSDEDEKFTYTHYLDDGESFNYRNGIYNEYEISIENKENLNISFITKNNKYFKNYRKVRFILNNFNGKDIIVNGIKADVKDNLIEINI